MGTDETEAQTARRHTAAHAQMVAGYQYLLSSTSPLAIVAGMQWPLVRSAVGSRQSAVEGAQ